MLSCAGDMLLWVDGMLLCSGVMLLWAGVTFLKFKNLEIKEDLRLLTN